MVFIQRIHDERWLRLLTVGLLIQPLSIIIFQTAPSVEEFYLASPIPYSIFGFNPIGNVLSDEKSGGLLFDNGNWAISFIFSLACIYLILFEGLTRLTLVIICMVSIFLTGSKSTFLLMPIVGFVGLLLWSISRSRKETAKFLGFSLTALSIIGIALTPTAIVLLGVTVDTFSYRLSFWTLALQNVGDYLWLGGGGGYWLDLFLTQGDVRWWREGIPVHNSLLSMLMVAGIMPVTLILLFFVKIIRIVLRCIYSVHTTQCARVQILTFLGLLWVFLHSQVSNMSIFGDTSTMVLTSLLVSLCFQSIGYDSAAYGCLPFRPKQMNHVRKESVN
ncbi:O-antigen ligase family protein [Thiocystis violacea]|uniref:O-antigen ligase family protein n=1 Tax=Thiocystis violacea TaxID=13725 RepID=UPI003B838E13